MTEVWRIPLEAAGFPTDAVVLDFETFFDTDYTLKKMTSVEFVMDPRFEVTGLGFGLLGVAGPCGFAGLAEVVESLENLQFVYGDDLEGCTVVVANGKFDCLILREKYGITPRFVVDVQDLGRNLDARDRHDIEYMAKKYKAPAPKGDTMQFKGLHWQTMTPTQRESLAAYCRDGDVAIEAHLFKTLLPRIVNPETELRLSNQTLRLFLEPNIKVNFELGKRLAAEMEAQVGQQIGELHALGINCVEPPRFYKRMASKPPIVRPVTPTDIRSDGSFVAMLADALPPSESVPMKQGKAKLIPALAKSDEALNYLLVHPEPKVRALVAARVACKSWPGHTKRVHRIMDQARLRGGFTGLPLTYYAAHTGRFGGTGGWNPQNLGARDVHTLIKQVGTMLEAPEGFVFGSGDLSQIEARVVAWLSGQDDLVRGFANNEDIYSELAQNTIFHKETYKKPKPDDSPEKIKAMKTRRDFGKMAILACIAEGTPVLTALKGFIPIEDVTCDDLVWDGLQFVAHSGVVYRGMQRCIQVNKVWMTLDHEVLANDGWCLAHDLDTRSQQLAIHSANYQLLPCHTAHEAVLSPFNAAAPVVERLFQHVIASSAAELRDAMRVLKLSLHAPIQQRRKFFQPTAGGYTAEFLRSLEGAVSGKIATMEGGDSECGRSGHLTVPHFCDILFRCLDGTSPDLRSIVLTTIKAIFPATYASLPERSKCETPDATGTTVRGPSQIVPNAEKSLNESRQDNGYAPSGALGYRPTYDILAAGPRRRYQAGCMIVANCGFGMGGDTFYDRAIVKPELRPAFLSGEIDRGFCQHVVHGYRQRYPHIVAYWHEVEKAWRFVTKYPAQTAIVSHNGHEVRFHHRQGTTVVTLPSGRELYYPVARVDAEGNCSYRWGYTYGGSLVENIVQASARDVFTAGLLRIDDAGFTLIGHIHDQILTLLSVDGTENDRLAEMHQLQTEPLPWTQGLPVATEGELSKTYKKSEDE